MPAEETQTRRASSRIAARPTPAPTKAVASAALKKAAAKTSKATNGASSKEKPAGATTEKKKAGGELVVGDKLPAGLVLKDEEGADVDVAALTKVVIFSYPKANTGGCTTQGKCYRDAYSEWQAAGYEVYGLSNDKPGPLKSWKEKQAFPYRLLSDPDRTGLIGPLTGSTTQTKRSHFVVDAEGKLALVSLSVKPDQSSKAALEFAKSL